MYKKPVVILFLLIFIFIPCHAEAYIGPGAGFAVMGSFLAMFSAVLSAILSIFSWPLRLFIRIARNKRAFARSRIRKCIILGFDGLDPELVETFMAEGKLPHLSRLRDQGCFKRLATSTPSISPVAWSSFQTGSNPGKHNIFDFLTRSRHTYQPILSSVDIRGPKRKFRLGKYEIPLEKADIRLLRKGKSFWKTLGEHGIFSNIIRVPITFPPEKFRGVQLSAMCVPDLRGTQGMFSMYTTASKNPQEQIGGEIFSVTRNDDTIAGELVGPENPLKKDHPILTLPFKVTIKNETSADFQINGKRYHIEKGTYSEWIKVSFKAAPWVKIHGIIQCLLLNITPEFELYITPVNIDPEKPVMPIAYPAVYSTYFSKRQGLFATLGLAEDTWALNERVLSDEDFLKQSAQYDDEREKMFLDSLEKVRHGLCVCVFDGTDRIQHTFWRYIDKDHPAHNLVPENIKKINPIEDVYKKMDALVGKTMDKYGKNSKTILMVISDHGFNSFRYGIDLNRWLEEYGYLKVKNGCRNKKNLSAVDWSKTRAYAIGLTGIYLNIKGRESQGIVDSGNEASVLREEIAGKLIRLINPQREQKAINHVYNAYKIYQGPYKEEAPDLIVGYNRGYRASWETAVGQVTDDVFHENVKAWSGDHCIDPSLVPGVLFCNKPVYTEAPNLMDIGPTVLDMFGVDVPQYMDGKPLIVCDEEMPE